VTDDAFWRNFLFVLIQLSSVTLGTVSDSSQYLQPLADCFFLRRKRT